VPQLVDLDPLVVPGGALRRVRAFVPDGPERARPLLLLFDGQNVFVDAGSFAGGWRAHEAVMGLGERTFERPVVVALDHGEHARTEELGSGAAALVDTLADRLVPWLRRRFPLTETTLGGASLGGLAALRGWLARPDVFRSAAVLSPSLWFGHRALLHALERGMPLPAKGRLYVDAGARERGRMFADAEHLCALLRARGLGADRLLWRPDQRGTHHERHWRRRLPKALRFLFRR
jgi:predicted alpha/beta superfamily hydrolase